MNLPWPTKKLGEICKENIKSSFKVEDANNSGIFPFFTSGEDILTHNENLVDGENLFLSTGGYFHIKYYKGKAGYSSDTWSLRVKDGLTKYVYYQILAKLKFIDSLFFRGSGLRHLQKQEFLNLQIPLPPLPEQQKIVYVLDTIQEAIGVQEKIIEKTKELKGAMMNLLFHYGTAILKVKEFASLRVGELTSEEFEKLTGQKLKKTEIGEIPESWEVEKLGNYIEEKKEKNRQRENLPVYSVSNIYGFILSEDFFDKQVYSKNLENYKLVGKDYFAYNPARINVGSIGLFNKDEQGLVSPMYVVFKIINHKKLSSQFLFLLLRTHYYTKLICDVANSHGSVRKTLSFRDFSNFEIPLPPLLEQQKIVYVLDTIQEAIEIEEKKKALYEELFKAMLDKLMTGEIRVNDIDL